MKEPEEYFKNAIGHVDGAEYNVDEPALSIAFKEYARDYAVELYKQDTALQLYRQLHAMPSTNGLVEMGRLTDGSCRFVTVRRGNKVLSLNFNDSGDQLISIGLHEDIIEVVDSKKLF